MKRFYCTICQRVKRVRVIPSSVRVQGDDVRSREGVCSWHHAVRRDSSIHSVQSVQQNKTFAMKGMK